MQVLQMNINLLFNLDKLAWPRKQNPEKWGLAPKKYPYSGPATHACAPQTPKQVQSLIFQGYSSRSMSV